VLFSSRSPNGLETMVMQGRSTTLILSMGVIAFVAGSSLDVLVANFFLCKD
jgi:hypothetical protein